MTKNIDQHLESLTEIKCFMERSSKFISLNGLSGVFAGVYGLLGAFAAWYYFNLGVFSTSNSNQDSPEALRFYILDALLILVLSLSTAIWLSSRKANRQSKSLFDKTAQRLVINLCIPLGVGGIFSLSLILQGNYGQLAPVMLIFYGLALVNASKYTFGDIRYLGLVEIVLGLINLFMIRYGFWFWCFGFGFMHIMYGLLMYRKYDAE
ncbi:hypothetical protein [Solitalea koreensis]|nr:hypothetical protein [Solitalea koreensis]